MAVTAFGQHYPFLLVPNSPHGIYAMMQDSKSRLWLGTIDDVYCFDGTNFYSIRQYGYPKETTVGFAEDDAGGIWIATQGTDVGGGSRSGGVYRYQSGRVERILTGDSMSIVRISPEMMLASMGIEADGRPTYGDVYIFRKVDDQWVSERVLDKSASHMTVDHRGWILFPCPGGWCEFNSAQLSSRPAFGAPLQMTRHAGDPLAEKVLRDQFGCVWVRAEIRASYQCPTDENPVQLPSTISKEDSSAHLEESPDGSILMLVPLAFGRPGKFRLSDLADLPAALDTALVARDGTIWLGTEGGLYRFKYPFRIESWPNDSGFHFPHMFIQRVENKIYSTANGIVVLDASRQKWTPIPNTNQYGLISAVIPLDRGNLLAATEDGTVVFGVDGAVISKNSSSGPGTTLARSTDGRIWLGRDIRGGGGISEVKTAGRRLVLSPQPVPPGTIYDMQVDHDRDILWACDGRDIIFRKNQEWGILARSSFNDFACSSLAIAPGGDLWVGYLGTSAITLIKDPSSDHPSFQNHTEELDKTLGTGSTRLFPVDDRGWIWRGQDHLYLGTIQAAESRDWLRLDDQDGISAPAQGHPFFEDTDGTIWLATDSGIVHFSPPNEFASRFPQPPIVLGGLAVGTDTPQLADTMQSAPRNQNLTAFIGSLQFDRRSALHFRYRLSPRDSSWIPTDDTRLSLGRLGWGRYKLQLQASMATGPWSESAEQSFEVMKPLWITWPALCGYLLAGGSLVVGGRRWSRKQRERLKKAFPELAEWRLAALSPELQELNGTLLANRFEVGRVIARGGFAAVVEGRDRQEDGRRCAIKIFRRELIEKAWMERRFQHEVSALRQIQHENVVRIYSSGTLQTGGLYLVMEFIEGATLREILANGKFAPGVVASYLRQTGSALDQMHSRGIYHRDLKPENIMIRSSARRGEGLVLIDFSIAIVKDPNETVHGLSRAAGTIDYMAPEQVVGYADSSTDIYSLAKVAIEMMTGKRLAALIPNASLDLPDRVRELLSHLPIGLSATSTELLASALSFDPAKRPKDAGDFSLQIAQDLDSIHISKG